MSGCHCSLLPTKFPWPVATYLSSNLSVQHSVKPSMHQPNFLSLSLSLALSLSLSLLFLSLSLSLSLSCEVLQRHWSSGRPRNRKRKAKAVHVPRLTSISASGVSCHKDKAWCRKPGATVKMNYRSKKYAAEKGVRLQGGLDVRVQEEPTVLRRASGQHLHQRFILKATRGYGVGSREITSSCQAAPILPAVL